MNTTNNMLEPQIQSKTPKRFNKNTIKIPKLRIVEYFKETLIKTMFSTSFLLNIHKNEYINKFKKVYTDRKEVNRKTNMLISDVFPN